MIADRRMVLSCGGAILAAALLPFEPAGAASLRRIGLQLYTVREIFRTDPFGTLSQVARIGYREVEFGGGDYEKMDHAALRRTMDRLGLRAPSVHIAYEALRDRFDASLTMARTLGADTVILPFMMPHLRNAAAWTTAVADFNRIAERLRKASLGFAYHNHDFEFAAQPDGVTLYERLLKDADPALVKLELDLYWAVKAGQDPRALIRRLAGRIYAYHLKDMTATGAMASVGAGTIDFAAILSLNAIAGVRHFYVENDAAPAPYLPDITASFEAARRLRFGSAS